jgi:hypothetical protein
MKEGAKQPARDHLARAGRYTKRVRGITAGGMLFKVLDGNGFGASRNGAVVVIQTAALAVTVAALACGTAPLLFDWLVDSKLKSKEYMPGAMVLETFQPSWSSLACRKQATPAGCRASPRGS